jgi:hypothetical protein
MYPGSTACRRNFENHEVNSRAVLVVPPATGTSSRAQQCYMQLEHAPSEGHTRRAVLLARSYYTFSSHHMVLNTVPSLTTDAAPSFTQQRCISTEGHNTLSTPPSNLYMRPEYTCPATIHAQLCTRCPTTTTCTSKVAIPCHHLHPCVGSHHTRTPLPIIQLVHNSLIAPERQGPHRPGLNSSRASYRSQRAL